MTKDISQPSDEIKGLLNKVLENKPSEVYFCGKKKCIYWWKKGTIRKYSDVMISETNIEKRMIKCCSLILLNNVFLIFFFHWIYWRWLYYVKDPDAVEVLRLLDASKKKIPYEAYSLNTILMTGMMDLLMTITRAEA